MGLANGKCYEIRCGDFEEMTKELADGSAEGEDDFAKGRAAVSKMKTTPVDAGASRLRTMRERAREARHAAYLLAKERRKNDPRTLELKERLKQARREANAQAKERRKSDPKEIVRKSKLKADRHEANRLAKEQRKAQAQSTMKAERASKDEKLRAGIASANALGQPRSSDDP